MAGWNIEVKLPDGIRFDAHYFSVGDKVFYNDGTVDSILNGGGE